MMIFIDQIFYYNAIKNKELINIFRFINRY